MKMIDKEKVRPTRRMPYTRAQIVGHTRRARKPAIDTRPKIKANASVESSSMASQVVWLGGVSGHCLERILVILPVYITVKRTNNTLYCT